MQEQNGGCVVTFPGHVGARLIDRRAELRQLHETIHVLLVDTGLLQAEVRAHGAVCGGQCRQGRRSNPSVGELRRRALAAIAEEEGRTPPAA